ncbi:hypothetical protein P4280_20960 [Bacillus thuringiensis]|nr:hypothetical protein [Bacillus thuringiensis]
MIVFVVVIESEGILIESLRKIDEIWITNQMSVNLKKYNGLLQIDYFL